MSREELLRLEKQALADLYAAVLRYAFARVGSRDRAADLTNEAFARVMTTRPWSRGDGATLERHLISVVNSLRSNEETSRRSSYERSASEQMTPGGATESAEAIALRVESASARDGRSARCVARLAELLTEPLDKRVLALMQEGVTEPALIAERTGASPEEIYRSKQRIRRCAARVREDEPNGDEGGV